MKLLLVLATLLLSSTALAGNDPDLDKAVSRYVAHHLKKDGNIVDSGVERYSLSNNTTPEAVLSYCVNEAPDANNPKVNWCGFAVFVSQNGRWVEAGHKSGSPEFKGKFIVTTEDEYKAEDALCCPSMTVSATYILTPKGLRRVKRERTDKN
jgi:hypothetical protein